MDSLQDLIQANQQTLTEAEQILAEISDQAYTKVISPFTASVGKHMRHIADHYFQFLDGISATRIDYDARARNESAESDRTEMIQVVSEIHKQLARCSATNNAAVSVILSIDETSLTPEVESTLARELVFLQSHTTHHCAIISAMLKLQGVFVPESFGIAASTLKYDQRQCAH